MAGRALGGLLPRGDAVSAEVRGRGAGSAQAGGGGGGTGLGPGVDGARTLRDLAWLEVGGGEGGWGPSWSRCEVGAAGSERTRQALHAEWGGSGPAGLCSPLLPTGPKTRQQGVRERGQGSSAGRGLAGPGRTRKGVTGGWVPRDACGQVSAER